MYRLLIAAAPLLLLSLQVPSASPAQGAAKTGKKCEKKKRSGGPFGAIARNVTGTALGQVGLPWQVAGLAFPVGSLLTDAIIDQLDCKEQIQAARATTEATRGGVGASSSWNSETRPGVSGSSTVTSQTARSDGASCMTVNDVIIVNGEETTAPKTMCRAPGATGYTLAA